MIYCSKCGTENDDDAEFCSKCGNSLNVKNSSFEKQVEGFAEGVGRFGKKAGKRFEETTKRFENATDRAGNKFESWYDRTFGVFGPLVSSFVGLIIVRLIIVGLNAGADETPALADVSDVLLYYLLLIFFIILIASYSSYVSKKYKPFRWVSPIIIAVLIVLLSTVAVNILSVVGASTGEPDFIEAETQWREKYMMMIFVIVILIGYLINVATLAFEKDKKK